VSGGQCSVGCCNPGVTQSMERGHSSGSEDILGTSLIPPAPGLHKASQPVVGLAAAAMGKAAGVSARSTGRRCTAACGSEAQGNGWQRLEIPPWE